MVKNFIAMMEGSLGLEEPWHVESAEFSDERQRIDIYVGIRPLAAFVCPVCGGAAVRDGYEPDERTWRHGDCMFHPTYVHCRRPRVKCPKCGVHQVNAPFERKGSRFTTYFEGYATMLMADMPRAKADRLLRCDEKSFRRGHSYVTVAVDADRRRVIDKFHVKQTVTNAMDEVRKEEQKEFEDKKELFRKRKLFFKPSAALTQEQAEEVAALSRRFPKTGRAFRIIASFDDFYRSRSVTEAETAFKRLYSWMRRCRLEPMKKAGETLMAHKDKIMAYFKGHITNAISEGINSLIQAAKRKARGFHTFEGFAAMIYLVAGKLELATPNPFRRIH